jgi:hypothetical protein
MRPEFVRPVLVVAMSFGLLSGCGGGAGSSPSNPPPQSGPVSVSVSPTSATVPAGSTQQFVAKLSNTTNTSVTWQVGGVTGGSVTMGTISSTGVYTAPLSPSAVGQVTVTAISGADSTKSASATVTPVFSNASVNGSYVFKVVTIGNTGFAFTAGVFTADGNGHITAGIEDTNDATNGARTNIVLTGMYNVGPDGRGTVTASTSLGTSTFKFVLISNTSAQLIEFDNTAASGFLSAQDPSAISAISGPFVFAFQGEDADSITSLGPAASVGQIVLNGSGSVSGVLDVNERGTFSGNLAFTGNYIIGSQGRGTAISATSYGTSNYVFYIVNAKTIEFLSVDPIPGLIETGTAVAQQSAPFGNGSLGSSVFLLSGGDASTGATLVAAGRFDTDGAGNLQNGVVDENDSGVFSDSLPLSAGSYSIASNGRGTISATTTKGTSTFVFWLTSPGNAQLIESDTVGAASGIVLAQQNGGFNNSSMQGNFAFVLGGASSSQPFAGLGQVAANGAGGFTGNEDVNAGGSTAPNVAINGTYSIGQNGHGAGTVTGAKTTPVRVLLISQSSGVFISADPAEPLIGLAEKQCSDCH